MAVSRLVQIRNLGKSYQRGTTRVDALRNVSLTVSHGQFIGVVGPSGSGKSTLLHLLAALDRPSMGDIQVGDWSVDDLPASKRSQYRRSMVGLIFQEFHLIPTMTAQENVALPLLLAGTSPGDRTKRARRMLERVGLAERRDHTPTELSGGEQQRVAAARALMGDPPLLLADEPTGNLDTETGAELIDLLSEVCRKQDRSVIVATHHREQIDEVTDRIFHLQDGVLGPSD